MLAWHGDNWHAAVGLDIYVPIGAYDEMDIANLGRNYWTFEPVVAGTALLPGEIEASIKVMYDINLKNEDTDYKSGDEFHFDYAVAKKVSKDWSVGVSGFYYTQTSEDESFGFEVADSKGSQLAYGPVVSFQKGKQTFILKWQIEDETENKPEGDRIWFKFIRPHVTRQQARSRGARTDGIRGVERRTRAVLHASFLPLLVAISCLRQ